MASVDREIRITATDNGVSQTFDKLKAKATEAARTIVEAAKKETSSVREMMDYINSATSQVKSGQANRYQSLIGKETQQYQSDINRFRTLTPEQRRQQGLPGTEDELTKRFQSRVGQLQKEAAESRKTNELLEKILEATISTSQAEIETDRNQVRRQLHSESSVDEMENDEAAMRQMIQRRLLTESQDEKGERSNRNYTGVLGYLHGNPLETLFRRGESISNRKAAESESSTSGIGLGALGLVLGGGALAVGAATERLEGLSQASRVSGLSKDQIEAKYGKLTEGLDITEAQGLQNFSQAYRSSGGALDKSGARAAMLAERGYGLDVNQVGKLANVGVVGKSGDVNGLLSNMIGILKETGLSEARLPDLLQLQVELQEKQLSEIGKLDPENTAKVINGLLRSGLNIGQTRETIGTLEGVISGNNPQVQAALFSMFQQGGGGSISDFLTEREKGVGGTLGKDLISRIREDEEMSEESKILTLHSLGFKTAQAKALLTEQKTGMLETNDLGIQATQEEYSKNQFSFYQASMNDGLAKAGIAIHDFTMAIADATKKIKDEAKGSGKTNVVSGKK